MCGKNICCESTLWCKIGGDLKKYIIKVKFTAGEDIIGE